MWQHLETSLRESRRHCPEPDDDWLLKTRHVALAGTPWRTGPWFRTPWNGLRRLNGRWALAIVVGVLCVATVGVAVAASHQGSGVPPPRSVDWAGNFGPGSKSVTLTAAASLLAFRPVAPEGVSAPTTVYVSDPRQPRARHAIELQFNDPTYGVFRLTESLAQVTEAELLAQANCPADTICPSNLSVVSLNGGARGLMIAGSGSTGVLWIKGGVLYDTYGPPETFTTKDAVAIANHVLAVSASKRHTPFD
jgi:hypothetical protein